MDVILVTMWALPVQQSVTVMTGHENVRKASKDSKNTPQDRSYLQAICDVRSGEVKRVCGICVPRNIMQLEMSHVGRVYLRGRELPLSQATRKPNRTSMYVRIEDRTPSLVDQPS